MNIRKFFLTLGFTGLLAFSAAAQSKIAIIDLRKVFDEYFKTKAADANLKEKAGELDKERKNLMDQYGKLRDDYKKSLDGANDQAVSADEREKRKKSAESKLLEIKELEQTIDQFDRQSRTSLEEQQRRMRDNILKEIQSVINTKAKSGNYSLVLDTASESFNKTPIVLYTNGENDLTVMVLKELNQAAPITAPASK
jgi:outer membrane protein